MPVTAVMVMDRLALALLALLLLWALVYIVTIAVEHW